MRSSAALFAIALCGCASNIDVRWGDTLLAPVDYEPAGEVLIAQDGDVLLQQQATAASTVLLQQPFSHTAKLEVSSATTTVSTDMPLYELVSPSIKGRLFCTIDNATRSIRTRSTQANPFATANPAPTFSSQACFVDNDGDGLFEELTGLTGQAASNGPGFGGMFVLKYKIDPIAYLPSSTRDPRTSTLGVRFENSKLRVVGIVPDGQFAWRNNGTQDGPYLLSREAAGIPSKLPATLTLGGAQIEVLSHEGTSISYRIIRGFPLDQPIKVSLQ